MRTPDSSLTDERRLSVIGARSAVQWIVAGVMFVATVTIGAVTLVTLYAAEDRQQAVIVQIMAFATPIIAMLLGGGLLKFATVTDGKLSLLLEAKEERARADGLLKGMAVNPKVNVTEADLPPLDK